MTDFNFDRHQRAGELIIKPYGVYPGNLTVDGDGSFGGTVDITGDLTVSGNITIADSTIVDVLASTIYNFADPILELNSQFSGVQVTGAGIRIDRQAAFDNAVIFYADPDGAGTAGYWYAGFEPTFTDHRIMTVDPALPVPLDTAASSNGIVMWDYNADPSLTNFKVIPDFTVPEAPGSTVVTVRPMSFVWTTTPHNLKLSTDTYYTDPIQLEHRNGPAPGALVDSYLHIGWSDPVLNGTLTSNTTTIVSDKALFFESGVSAFGATHFGFDDIIYLDIESAGVGRIVTTLPTLLVQSAVNLNLTAPTEVNVTTNGDLTLSGTNVVNVLSTTNIVLDCGANNINVESNIDATGQTLTVDTINVNTINIATLFVANLSATNFSAENYTYANPVGFEPIPVVPGWAGPITIGTPSVTYNVATAERANEQSYLLSVSWDNVTSTQIADGVEFTFEIPLDINLDMASVRNIVGVTTRRAAVPPAIITNAYPITATKMYFGVSKQIEPTYLTAANMTDYNVLYLTVTGAVGYFTATITVTIAV